MKFSPPCRTRRLFTYDARRIRRWDASVIKGADTLRTRPGRQS